MITRIVKMTFREGKTDDFLKIFEASKEKIKAFPGCLHLELWRGTSTPTIFFTHSKWESEEALENYRKSALFKATWAKTKVLFTERAEAWSLA